MRRSPIFALTLLASGSLILAACTQDFGIFAGNQGGSGGTSTITTGGTGGVGGCTADSECNDTNPCTEDSCDLATGKCANDPLPDGDVPTMPDMQGDCYKPQCISGKLENVDDDADVPANTNPCVTVACNMGSVVKSNVGAGTSCGPAPQKCDGEGNCVGCQMNEDCPAVGDCQQKNCDSQHVCAPTDKAPGAVCNSMGGDVCDGSGSCVACVTDGDCNGPPEICTGAHQCVSSCGDGVENGDETDQDCGGPCPDCGTGKKCQNGPDCASGVCTGPGQKTCKAPACNDNTQNGGETDVDCGGAASGCPKCGDGDKCTVAGDCMSNRCTNGVCTSCSDGAQNGGESDVDCGGATSGCSKCGDGDKCAVAADCTSNRCTANVCTSCTDGAKNGPETDVDCGGSCTTKCANTKMCAANSDCQSNRCTNNVCTSCTDGVKNGPETDVDCGGTCTTKCADTKACTVDGDCMSNTCIANVCYPATCKNTTKDGTETDIDCGGTACPKCAATKGCAVNADCTSAMCDTAVTPNVCK